MVVCDMVLLWLTLIRKEKTLKSMPLFIIVKLRPETEILSCLWHTSLCEQDKISHWFCFWQKLCNRLLIMRLGPREILIYNLGLNTDWTIVICSLCLKEITMLESFYLFIFCKQMQRVPHLFICSTISVSTWQLIWRKFMCGPTKIFHFSPLLSYL